MRFLLLYFLGRSFLFLELYPLGAGGHDLLRPSLCLRCTGGATEDGFKTSSLKYLNFEEGSVLDPGFRFL
jgi:hypothetical protein